jgi:hypothetical protein
MNLKSSVLTANHAKIERTPELNLILTTNFLLLIYSSIQQHSHLQYLSCVVFAFVFSVWKFLPSKIDSIKVSDRLPDNFQNKIWSSHFVILEFDILTKRLPSLNYQELISNESEVKINSPIIHCVPNNNNEFKVRSRIQPLSQGELELSGFVITTHTGLGLFKWTLEVPYSQYRLCHAQSIQIDHLKIHNLMNHNQLIDSNNTLETMVGEEIGWPREYQFGDPISKIDWKRLACNPLAPTIHSSFTPELPKIILIVDGLLKKRVVGDKEKLYRLSEFAKAISFYLMQNGIDVQAHVISKQYYIYNLRQSQENSNFHNTLACLKFSNSITHKNKVMNFCKDKWQNTLHLKIDPYENDLSKLSNISLGLAELQKFEIKAVS